MGNKNLLLAIGLSAGFMFFWSTYVVPRLAPAPPAKTEPVSAPGSPTAPPMPATAGQTLVPAHTERPLPEAILRDLQNEIVFSPVGGGVRHWRLKLKGQEIDLVNNPESPPPLTTFPGAVYNIQQQDNTITLRTDLQNGLRLTKILTLNPTGFLHDMIFRFENLTSQPVELKDVEWGWGPGLGTVGSEKKENSSLIRALSMGKQQANVLKPGEYNDFGQWAAIDNRYFLVAFLPPTNRGAVSPPALSVTGTEEQTVVKVRQSLTVPPRGKVALPYKIYAGPKGYTQLGHYNLGLEASVDFGFFSALGKLVLRTIYWLQSRTGNYGWAIVLLTIILDVLLLPLTIKSFKATMAMKQLQPQIAELQKNYKSDPKRLQVETMHLYKKSGANPLGGCLPMLLQLPIFWALFTTLRNAYELLGAPFVGWIQDLSAADPYYVLPLVMGAAMFVQQRMAGAVTDPMQRQMMWMMPIIFVVMFINFPSGLVLYWLTNNLVTMAFQWMLLRKSQKPSTLELVH